MSRTASYISIIRGEGVYRDEARYAFAIVVYGDGGPMLS